MGPLVIVVLVGLTLVIAARSIRGTLTDRRSLEEHHRALDTLGGVAHQQDGATPLPFDPPGARAHVRIVGTKAAQPAPEPSGNRGPPPRPAGRPPVMPAAHNETQPSPTPPPAHRELQPTLTPQAAGATVAPASHRDILTVPSPAPPEPEGRLAGTVAPPATSATPRRRRRRALVPGGALALAAVVVVTTGIGVAAILNRSDRSHPPADAIAVPAATNPVPSTTTTTTVPVVLVSSDSQGARYNLASSASVELVPSSPCWVEIRAGNATGTLVFQGVLRPGDHRPIPATTPVWLRLGNPPGVTIVVNGSPLQPPGRSSSRPYNVTFAPATNG
jgi:Domain of unknown function (DUF4115)